MKASTINELKQELQNIPPSQLAELCLRLAKFKKENKELLTYLLFEAHDEPAYIESVQQEIALQFEGINKSTLYFAKKSIRKILRMANKYIRFAGSKTVEAEVLTFFCSSLNASGIPFQQSTALLNLYKAQLKKIKSAVDTLHEDLQYEYHKSLRKLEISG